MTTTTATKGNEIQIGRFLVTFCPADEDGPDGWEIRGTGEESEDVLDSYETKREAVKVAKDMEADRLQDEKDEREAEEEEKRAEEADAIHTRVTALLEKLQGRADDLNDEAKVEKLTALLAALKTI